MDLLGYSDANITFCFKDKSKREIHDVLRQIYIHRDRIHICPCCQDPWVRKTLQFLGAQINNESSHQ